MLTWLTSLGIFLAAGFLVSLFLSPRTWFVRTTKNQKYHSLIMILDGGLTVDNKALVALAENPHLTKSNIIEMLTRGPIEDIVEGLSKNKNFPIEVFDNFPQKDPTPHAMMNLKTKMLNNPNIPETTRVALALIESKVQ